MEASLLFGLKFLSNLACAISQSTQDKLEISYDDPDQMGLLIFCYIEGLQWVMHYYYSGVCSWGWFYRYHYAPRISGVCRILDHILP